MTVAELMAALQKLPPETVVLGRYEAGGWWNMPTVRIIKVFRAFGRGGYGQFQAESLAERNNLSAVLIE